VFCKMCLFNIFGSILDSRGLEEEWAFKWELHVRSPSNQLTSFKNNLDQYTCI